jgi:hypothetical protein
LLVVHAMRTFVLLFALGLVGCGTSSSTNDAGTDSSGGCIDAKEGDSCNANDNACSLGDACCNGAFVCQSGKWMKEFPGCACQVGTFTCGTQTCSTGQICKTQESGIDGGLASYSCDDVPSTCTTDQSCACASDAGVCAPTAVASCMDSQGHLVVDCMGQ